MKIEISTILIIEIKVSILNSLHLLDYQVFLDATCPFIGSPYHMISGIPFWKNCPVFNSYPTNKNVPIFDVFTIATNLTDLYVDYGDGLTYEFFNITGKDILSKKVYRFFLYLFHNCNV